MPTLKSPRPKVAATQLSLLVDSVPTIATSAMEYVQAIVTWDALDEKEQDPNARYRSMLIDDVPLNVYLSDKIHQAVRRWSMLKAEAPSYAADVERIKDGVLLAVQFAHKQVRRPGADRSYLTHATALCANAIRTVTAIANFIILVPKAAKGEGMMAKKLRIFNLSEHVAGMRNFNFANLPKGMLPFGTGRKITSIKRETPCDTRLLANLFGCHPDEIQAHYGKALQKLRDTSLGRDPSGENGEDLE